MESMSIKIQVCKVIFFAIIVIVLGNINAYPGLIDEVSSI